MKMNENIKITGRLKVDYYKDGVLVKEGEWRNNVITTTGKNSFASLLNSASAGTTLVSHMGFGTSTTAVAATDTVLGTELTIGSNGYNRATVTRSNPSGNVIQYLATLTGITAATTVQEAGLFSAASAGTLVAHQLTGSQPLNTSADSLQVTWQLTFS
jgi:hypothetical protein